MKKIYQKIIFILVVSSLFTLSISAQLKTKIFQTEVPVEIMPTKSKIEKVRKIDAPPEFNNLKQKAKDSKLIESEDKFAVAVSVNLDLLKEGNENNEGGMLMYSLAIKSEEALNLSLQFKEFHLSKNAILSIYTKNEITDSITEKENNESNIWATRVYQGNTLFIVLKLPSEEKKEVSLKINKVNLGYKPFGMDFGNIGFSAPCHINANCPEGNGWDNEKNSVAMIVADGRIQCTGSLIMNACNSNIPYLLTANHCLEAGNVPNWVFQFQTWSTTCFGNVGWREDVQFNGCQLRANNAASDFALLQMNTTPAANSGINYAGWSRQTIGVTSTTILHHPAGDLMKISRDTHAPVSVTSSGVDCWQLDLDLGHVEGGSSGAPYFNQNHQVIGQHWRRPEAGTKPICDITVTLGGRFDRSWIGGGTNATRLSNWLDPSYSGALITNTTNVANLFTYNGYNGYIVTNGQNSLCSGGFYTYSLSSDLGSSTAIWTISPPTAATIQNLAPNGQVVSIIPAATTTNIPATVTVSMNNGLCPLATSITIIPNTPLPYTCSDVGAGTCIQYVCYPSPGSGNPLQLTIPNPTLPNTANWHWQIYNGVFQGNVTDMYVPYYIASYNIVYPNNNSCIVTVRPVNSCGLEANDEPFKWIIGSYICSLSQAMYTVSPNPAFTTVTIAEDKSVKDATVTAAKTGFTDIEIYNKMSILKKRLKYPKGTKSATIDISSLPLDNYVLRIFNGKTWEEHKLLIAK